MGPQWNCRGWGNTSINIQQSQGKLFSDFKPQPCKASKYFYPTTAYIRQIAHWSVIRTWREFILGLFSGNFEHVLWLCSKQAVPKFVSNTGKIGHLSSQAHENRWCCHPQNVRGGRVPTVAPQQYIQPFVEKQAKPNSNVCSPDLHWDTNSPFFATCIISQCKLNSKSILCRKCQAKYMFSALRKGLCIWKLHVLENILLLSASPTFLLSLATHPHNSSDVSAKDNCVKT